MTTCAAAAATQWLLVLKRLTANSRVSPKDLPMSRELADFLAILVQHGVAAKLGRTCVGLLVNLCRQSRQMQEHVRALPTSRTFYRALVAMLSDSDVVLIISALCLLANLLLGDSDLCRKLFNPQNIGQVGIEGSNVHGHV